jgi:hypothetical protein
VDVYSGMWLLHKWYNHITRPLKGRKRRCRIAVRPNHSQTCRLWSRSPHTLYLLAGLGVPFPVLGREEEEKVV